MHYTLRQILYPHVPPAECEFLATKMSFNPKKCNTILFLLSADHICVQIFNSYGQLCRNTHYDQLYSHLVKSDFNKSTLVQNDMGWVKNTIFFNDRTILFL